MPEFEELIEAAIRESVADGTPGATEIAGYALIVDCDMVSVLAASVSRSFVRASADDEILFCPVDWPTEYYLRSFSLACEGLPPPFDCSYDERARRFTGSLVQAMERARRLEPALAEAMLLVVCADGDGFWDQIAGEMVLRLNGTEVHERWLKFVDRYRRPAQSVE